MKRVIVIDDEGSGRRLIRQYLTKFDDFRLIDEAKNGIEAVEKINAKKPDLIFLDVQMPGLSGFEVLKHLDEIPSIIFSTAYDQYAIEAFDVHAVDYLLKPYTKERFEKAISKLIFADEVSPLSNFAESLLFKKENFPQQILVNKNRRLVAITVSEISSVEAYGDYSKIISKCNSFVSNSGISALEQKLNPDIFKRVHRSHIINMTLVESFEKAGKGFFATMKSGEKIRVSRGYAEEVKKIIL